MGLIDFCISLPPVWTFSAMTACPPRFDDVDVTHDLLPAATHPGERFHLALDVRSSLVARLPNICAVGTHSADPS
jgi:hypothetical protein